MAVDEALFAAVETNEEPPTLRLYQWREPSVSIGRFQALSRTFRLEAAQQNGLPVVRRISGGRGILHGDDLTVSLSTSSEALGFSGERPPGICALYDRITSPFVGALRQLGIPAALSQEQSREVYTGVGDCFATVTRADVMDADTGCKIVGGAVYRRDRFCLYQASLPLFSEHRAALFASLRAELFTGKIARMVAPSGSRPDGDALRSAFRSAVARTFHIALETGSLSAEELESANALVQRRYGNLNWTLQVRHARSAFDRAE